MSSYHHPMERVLFNLHHRICTFALRHTSTRLRSWAEKLLLLLAFCAFGALLLAHVSFVHREHLHSHNYHHQTPPPPPHPPYYYTQAAAATAGAATTTATTIANNKPSLAQHGGTSSSSPVSHGGGAAVSYWSDVPRPRSSEASPVYQRRRSGHSSSIPLSCLPSIPGFHTQADLTHIYLLEDDVSSSSAYTTWPTVSFTTNQTSCSWKDPHNPNNNNNNNDHSTSTREDQSCPATSSPTQLKSFPSQYIQLSYSRVKGYLLLPPHEHNPLVRQAISIQHVFVSKANSQCFGEPFLQELIFRLYGPETVMINWLLAAMDQHTAPPYQLHDRPTTTTYPYHTLHHQQPRSHYLDPPPTAYIYHPRTNFLMDLRPPFPVTPPILEGLTIPMSRPSHTTGTDNNNNNNNDPNNNNNNPPYSPPRESSSYGFQLAGSKLSILLKTCFLYFITTTLVSFTLRETQERMLDFTHQLQVHVRNRRPVVHLVTRHLVDNLVFVPIMVGMIFFLIEFYSGDKVLAFLVLSIVWVYEAFTVVSVRSFPGIHFFPRIFFLLFALFHFYLFSFPFGFSYAALASTVCFMLHSMLFFWHRFELPAVALGQVTAETPRIYQRPSPAAAGPYHPIPHHNPTAGVASHIPPTTAGAATAAPGATTTTGGIHASSSPSSTTSSGARSHFPGPSSAYYQVALQHPSAVPGLATESAVHHHHPIHHHLSLDPTLASAGLSPSSGRQTSSPQQQQQQQQARQEQQHQQPVFYHAGSTLATMARRPSRHNLQRSTSYGTNSSTGGGYIPRQPSAAAFHSDEDDASYMFYMGGEVVLQHQAGQHMLTSSWSQRSLNAQQQQQQQQQQQSSSSGNGMHPLEPALLLQRMSSGRGIPDHVLAEVGVGPEPPGADNAVGSTTMDGGDFSASSMNDLAELLIVGGRGGSIAPAPPTLMVSNGNVARPAVNTPIQDSRDRTSVARGGTVMASASGTDLTQSCDASSLSSR